jgi:ABC-type glycerol-3-phosphate transport system permease component
VDGKSVHQAIIYSLPPIAIYFAPRRFMVAGLAMGGVKG